MKDGSPSIWALVKQYPVFALFICSYTAVHLVFEYNFWLTSGDSIFGKYAESIAGDGLLIAQRVYFAKATWMFALIWLLVLRLPLRAAITWSFMLYSVELVVFFDLRPYLVLNVLLAIGLVVELLVRPAAPPSEMRLV